jgi:hypothetical protein
VEIIAAVQLGNEEVSMEQDLIGWQQFLDFQILDHFGVIGNEPIGALAHLGLGRAYAMEGDAAKATAAYHDFFVLWEQADPENAILKQAKAEYAKLK